MTICAIHFNQLCIFLSLFSQYGDYLKFASDIYVTIPHLYLRRILLDCISFYGVVLKLFFYFLILFASSRVGTPRIKLQQLLIKSPSMLSKY